MVEDEIGNDLYPVSVRLIDKIGILFLGAKMPVHIVMVCDGIAMVFTVLKNRAVP